MKIVINSSNVNIYNSSKQGGGTAICLPNLKENLSNIRPATYGLKASPDKLCRAIEGMISETMTRFQSRSAAPLTEK